MSDERNPIDGDDEAQRLSRSAQPVADVPSTIPIGPRNDPSTRRILVIAGERVSTHPLPESGEFAIGRADDANQTRAAKLLRISRNTLLARLDANDIPRPRKPR